MRHVMIAGLLPLALLGCTSDEEIQARLEVACAVKKCECVSEDKPLLKPAERQDVLWAQNGNAYCPQGFALAEFVDTKKREPGGLRFPGRSDFDDCLERGYRCGERTSRP